MSDNEYEEQQGVALWNELFGDGKTSRDLLDPAERAAREKDEKGMAQVFGGEPSDWSDAVDRMAFTTQKQYHRHTPRSSTLRLAAQTGRNITSNKTGTKAQLPAAATPTSPKSPQLPQLLLTKKKKGTGKRSAAQEALHGRYKRGDSHINHCAKCVKYYVKKCRCGSK